MTDPVEDSWPGQVPAPDGSPGEEGNPAPTLFDPASTIERLPTASATADLPEVPGYEVLARLGQGGMGVVFRARDLRLGRLVALKMIRDGLLATPAHVARFQGEARAVARLHHPHIVQIFHVGETAPVPGVSARPYLALELVEGGNLAQRLHARPLSARQAATLVETLARAMHHAHQQGIVHRDLKPANILLRKEGAGTRDEGIEEDPERTDQFPVPYSPVPRTDDLFPVITDFGLAKELEAEIFLTHTASATVLGTPSYMAPEQAWGHPDKIGAAVDIYALGAILYECLTGKPPFLAETLLEVLDQVRDRDPVGPRTLNPLVPTDLETIVLKCLRKDPRERYVSAEALADDLARYLRGEPIKARPTGVVERAWKALRRRPALAVMTGLLLLSLTATAVSAWYTRHWAQQQQDLAKADVARANYPSLLQQAQQALAQHRRDAARRLLDDCPADVRGWEWHLLSDQADGHTPPRLAGLKQPVQALAFDPVRHHLFAATETGIRNWDPDTLQELATLPTEGRVKDLIVSPDGRYLAALVEPSSQPVPTRLFLPLPLQWLSPLPSLFHTVRVVHAGIHGAALTLPEGADIVPSKVQQPEVQPQAPFPLVPPTVLVLPARRDEVRVWDLATRRLVIRWECPSGPGRQAPVRLAFQPDGTQLAVLASARVALQAPAGVNWWPIPRPGDDPFACAAEVIPQRPAVEEMPAPPASLVAFFDLRLPRLFPRIVALDGDECLALAYAPDGKTLALGSAHGRVRLLDVVTGRVRTQWHGPEGGSVVSLAYDPAGGRLAAGTAEGHVDLWDVTTENLLHMLPGHWGAVRELHFHPKEARLFTLGQDGHLKVWHLGTGQALSTLRVGSGAYFPVMSLDARGEKAAVASALDGPGNFGLTLFGMRAAGKPEAWQPRPGDAPGLAQKRPPRQPQPLPAPAALAP
jgi:serine/threonine protein kinase/WD40 repeat protein